MNDENKKKVNQFCEAQVPLVRELIDELSPHGITHFCYNKFIDYNDYIVLDSHIKEFRELFDYEKDQGILLPQLHALKKNMKYSLWQCLSSASPVAGFFINKNINHGIALFRQVSDKHHEVFHFASTNDNALILDFYLNNLDLLHDAADRFVHKLETNTDPSIIVPLAQLNIRNNYDIDSFNERKRKIRETTICIHQNNWHPHGNEVALSAKQLLCFELLRRGYTDKQIAQIRGTSYRTIEAHVAFLLKKLDIPSRYDLLNLPITIKRTN